MAKPTKVWWSIYNSEGIHSDLWVREVEFTHLPRLEERVATVVDTEEPEGGMHQDVVEVYFDFDGTANVTIIGMIVDPTQAAQDTFFRGPAHHNPRIRRTAWYSDRDGTREYLTALLRESGWLPYLEWSETHG